MRTWKDIMQEASSSERTGSSAREAQQSCRGSAGPRAGWGVQENDREGRGYPKPREVRTKEVQSRYSRTDHIHTTTEKAPQTSTSLSFDLNDDPPKAEGGRSPPALNVDLGLGLNYGADEETMVNDMGRGHNNTSLSPVIQFTANPTIQFFYSNPTRSHTQLHTTIQPHSPLSHTIHHPHHHRPPSAIALTTHNSPMQQTNTSVLRNQSELHPPI